MEGERDGVVWLEREGEGSTIVELQEVDCTSVAALAPHNTHHVLRCQLVDDERVDEAGQAIYDAIT